MPPILTPYPALPPWAGGGSENLWPPLARRCCRWLSPSNEATTLRGPWLETPTPAAIGAVLTRGAVCSIERLRLTPCWLWELALPPVAGKPISCRPVSAPSDCGLKEVEPTPPTCRVTPPLPVDAPTVGAIATVAANINAARAPLRMPNLRYVIHTPFQRSYGTPPCVLGASFRK